MSSFSRSPLNSRRVLFHTALAMLVGGCASGGGGAGKEGLIDRTLELVGLRKPELPPEIAERPARLMPTKLSLRIHAGEQLNTDAQSRSLTVVTRVYKLRSIDAFLAAPYKAFGTAESERAAFGDALVEVRELVLAPGQKHEVVETMPLEAQHLAVVALFRSPSEGRWRYAFNAKEAEKSGITVGLHGCAISVAAGVPEHAAPETLRLAGVNCR